MDGRAWYSGPDHLDLEVNCPQNLRTRLIADYLSGVLDTIDGSHGFTFTYLPVLIEDDCQVDHAHCWYRDSPEVGYSLKCTFL
jgi:hypothetical protein